MKTSARGLHFFAHKSRGPCRSAPETEAHLALKTLAAQAAQRAGWTCETEVSGSSPSGETWTADVLAYKGQAKVAIEIQWSSQTNAESLRRQERYRQSGVRCLWLFRRPDFPASKDFPAARISGDIATGFEAHVGRQAMPLDEFLDAAFARRFRYGIPVGAKAAVRIQSGETGCSKCEEVTWIVTVIEVSVGPHRFQLRVPDLTDFPDLLASCLEHVPRGSGVGRIKPRYSSAPRNYMSNGCCHCDALINYARCENHVILAQFPISISDRWRQALDPRNEHGWSVFALE